MRDDDLNLIKMELDRQSTGEMAPSQLAHQIESLAAASRTLETSLIRERTYSKQLREYANNLITKMHFLQKQEKDISERMKDFQHTSEKNSRQVQEMSTALQKARHELSQYRTAWAQILSREKHAQYILSRGDATAKRIQELELALSTLEKRLDAEKSGREKAEGHAATHRQELQTALVRLHSSEARYNDMARELEAIHSLRKNHTLELSRAEQTAREKLELQFNREREQLLQELSRERDEFARNRLELERARRELEARFTSEIQRLRAQSDAQSQQDKQRADEALRAEIAQETARETALEREKMESIIRALGDESKTLRQELSESRTEVSTIEQSSRQLELDLLRSREETAAFQKQLQKQLDEERGRKNGLEQALQTADKARKDAERAQRELESAVERDRDRSAKWTRELFDLIQSDRRQMQRLVERLIGAWGSEDAALCEALEALRDACEVRTVRTDAVPSKLEIVTNSSRLNC